jgi:hypothetical protein
MKRVPAKIAPEAAHVAPSVVAAVAVGENAAAVTRSGINRVLRFDFRICKHPGANRGVFFVILHLSLLV